MYIYEYECIFVKKNVIFFCQTRFPSDQHFLLLFLVLLLLWLFDGIVGWSCFPRPPKFRWQCQIGIFAAKKGASDNDILVPFFLLLPWFMKDFKRECIHTKMFGLLPNSVSLFFGRCKTKKPSQQKLRNVNS